MIFWVMAQDYDPESVRVSDPVKTHKPYFFARFYQGKKWVTLFFYQYYTSPTANFYWQSSESAKGVSTIASAPLTGVKAGDWIQLAATWDEKEIKVYLNGEPQSNAPLPASSSQTMDLVPEPKRSWIGVRQMMWTGADESGKTAIDDLKIFSRPLTALEIRRQYVTLVDSIDSVELPPFDMSIAGVDDRKADLDRVDITVDLTALPKDWRSELELDKLKLYYRFTLPDSTKRSGKWELSGLKNNQIFDKISQVGDYEIDLVLIRSDGERKRLKRKFYRPETKWHGNLLGLEDRVPEPWTPLSIDSSRTVKMWGREYHFDESPLPIRILHQGESVLRSGPELIIQTPDGKAVIEYSHTSVTEKPTSIVMKGTGKASTFTLDWTTRIEFDGMIRFDFTINGEPVIESMKLAWDVAPEFSKYLLTPLLKTADQGVHAFPINLNSRGSVSQLWLTSARKGFCWTLEHDANWVYEKGDRAQ